ncbi:MAG: hypothetical protein LAP39_18315 [Acidobacteriia bacterium]|nr:hypothetical protein [Terriglobia bacterium]
MRNVWLLAVLGTLLIAGNVSGATVACPSSSTLAALVTSFNSLSNACFSQDVMFWGFTYTSGASAPAASSVTSGLIGLSVPGLDIHGWNFDSTWAQGGVSSLADFTLSYTMEVCPTSGQPCSGNVIPGIAITGADATYAPVSVFPPGSETVDWSNGAVVTLTNGSPGALPSNGNIGLGPGFSGPITVTATFSGTGAITQTSLRFYETLGTASAVPEPGYTGFLLGGLILLGVVVYQRKERVTSESQD